MHTAWNVLPDRTGTGRRDRGIDGEQALRQQGIRTGAPALKFPVVEPPAISERTGTTSKFDDEDALGPTRGITNSSRSLTDAVLSDAFGMTVSRTSTTATPFGITHKRVAGRTGLPVG